MNTKDLIKTTVIFIALSILGICFIVIGQQADLDALQHTLPYLGSAILASGLTFFMIEVVNYARLTKV
jgi:hypothetical protein